MFPLLSLKFIKITDSPF